jgi:murein DD-endopeptidase MepM/ murein hydrolase activator NlpD
MWARGIIIEIVALLVVPTMVVWATTADELRQQIDDHTQKIQTLDSEIAAYEKQLNQVSAEKNTLQSAVKSIDISTKKVTAGISSSQEKIKRTELQLVQIGDSIEVAKSSIDSNKSAISAALRVMNEADETSIVEILLSGESLGKTWESLSATEQFQAALSNRVATLKTSKQALEDAHKSADDRRGELVDQRQTLEAQKQALAITKKEKSSLLNATKEQEASYQKLLAQKKASKAAFEAAMGDLESQLAYVLDPSKIPSAGKGVLRWPLDNVKITQKFGNTDFAKSGAYNGAGHNGIDFGVAIGTPIRSSLSGVISAVGNTDEVPGCYSYGKWIMVRHGNGLSTLYAHLSSINVSEGQSVETGQVIGLSGFTGYATGPHLHFGLYVSDAVQFVKLGQVKSKTNCANARVPVSPYSGYLDPLEYL